MQLSDAFAAILFPSPHDTDSPSENESFECSQCHRVTRCDCTEVAGYDFCERDACLTAAENLASTVLSADETARIYAFDDALEVGMRAALAAADFAAQFIAIEDAERMRKS